MLLKSFTITLIGNKSDQMQFEISHAQKGMKVECSEDDERYLIETEDSWHLGYLPKKVSNELEELLTLGYEILNCEIVDIINESGIKKVVVKIDLNGDEAFV